MSTRTAMLYRYLSDNVHAFLYLCHPAPGRCADVITIFRLETSMWKMSLFPDCFWQDHLESSLCCKIFSCMPMGLLGCLWFFRSISRKEQSCIWELLSCWFLTAHGLQSFHHNTPIVYKICEVREKGVPKNTSSSDKAHLSYYSSLNRQFSIPLPRIGICLHMHCLIILCNVKTDKEEHQPKSC